jgi:hypothetical protein
MTDRLRFRVKIKSFLPNGAWFFAPNHDQEPRRGRPIVGEDDEAHLGQEPRAPACSFISPQRP